MPAQPPLRDAAGPIRNLDGLRRAGSLLASYLDLPHAPILKVGDIPWKGSHTPIIGLLGAPHGSFTVARWAIRGRHRASWASLEYALVCGIGHWLESQRRDPIFSDTGTSKALLAWYGDKDGRKLVERLERKSRILRFTLIGGGGLLAVYLILWMMGFAR